MSRKFQKSATILSCNVNMILPRMISCPFKWFYIFPMVFINATKRTHDSQLVGNKQTISHASFEGGIGGGCWASRGCWLNLEEVRRREKKHFPTGAAAGN